MATKALIENQLAKCAVDAKFDVLFVNRSGANFGTKYDIVEADALEFNLGFTADVATARDLAFHFEKALDPVLSAAQTFPFDVELYAEVPGPLRSAVANAIEDFRRTNP